MKMTSEIRKSADQAPGQVAKLALTKKANFAPRSSVHMQLQPIAQILKSDCHTVLMRTYTSCNRGSVATSYPNHPGGTRVEN
jgi:hypothetical protein